MKQKTRINNSKKRFGAFLALAVLASLWSLSCKKESAESHMLADQKVYFVEPADGAVITGLVKVVMGIEGMEVTPAGELVENTGHHHLIINGSSVQEGEVVPKDERHIHFGNGQSETTLALEPGEYTLTLQFANGAHLSYGEGMSNTIHITVK